MIFRWQASLIGVMLLCSRVSPAHVKGIPVSACGGFAVNGALATVTIRDQLKIEVKIQELAAQPKTLTQEIPFSKGCELAFSPDGKWLAIAVRADALRLLIFDRSTGQLESQFSSDWLPTREAPFELMTMSWHSFLGGFLPDDSVELWRYYPHQSDSTSKNNPPPPPELHRQTWSIDGDLISDESAAKVKAYLDLKSGVVDGAEWAAVPNMDGVFLSVPEQTKRTQNAELRDRSGAVRAQADLPVPVNIMGPLVPDWFYSGDPKITADGKVAVIVRHHVAWVLVDDDRDWGSEINVLTTDPLRLVTTLHTGLGGIQVVEVDHRGHIIRLVGFWKNHWHDLRWDETHPGQWKSVKIL